VVLLRARRTGYLIAVLWASAACNGLVGIHQPDDLSPDAGCDIPGCPLSVQEPHLRLWLRADKGVTCETVNNEERITRWADQSGQNRNATLAPGQIGPYCAGLVPALSGPLPYFAARATNLADETMNLDLGFLEYSDYTLLFVERRIVNAPRNPLYILGTTVRDLDPTDTSLHVGYRLDTTFTLAQYDDDLDIPVAAQAADAPLSVDVAILDQTRGHFVYVNGSLAGSNGVTKSLRMATEGHLGTGGLAGYGDDQRFMGQIAEVIVYDAALSDVDRSLLEQYLRLHWGLTF
jgi:hypothetical protein